MKLTATNGEHAAKLAPFKHHVHICREVWSTVGKGSRGNWSEPEEAQCT